MPVVDLNALIDAIPDQKLLSGSRVLRFGVSPVSQRTNAKIIISEFTKSGYSPAVTVAALVNSWEESRWIADVWGDSNLSGGLFQLHTTGGAGRGMTRAQVENPVLNTRRIIAEVGQYGRELVTTGYTAIPVAELSAIFARDIERPADPVKAGSRRRTQTYELFPSVASAASGTLTRPLAARAVALASAPLTAIQTVASSGAAWVGLLASVGAVAAFSLAFWVVVRRWRG
jgi:hypothetical protein